ncbi:tRNA uridine-5-carboxymethylaminomethyl(34) synthesis GTPase MnmE [Methylophaga pinxianii]|uniref:tRNA uridine-5-carboxymethylaminomethyl(34) synthesis GTPase MnmE n=1 Tax=Methylophaga pinxianii TaxID=2881052 RepID=UPI001CF46728|nr:tRNA uridine-5-carboxymethylaminomethyl(34) synthesis GTPase MnmE [Methylophaga pinxianii]MCB2428033.1 tRNA uridine-5-carboxymethylaminomethyl(34) synthesis GTPase MnmE [Methylophaga pinxianii]UPH46090.1 tRNA uridine-5-carboxymethylaminomethyl(34) synthesis GTPase MnmE [Methylophaga pinxianii]
MTETYTDTIVAIATAPGRGGVGVVRLSGPQSVTIAEQICGKLALPRMAKFTHFRATDKEIIDSGIVLYFAGPASFTGEDVIEMQGHGSPLVMDRLCQQAIQLGARMARPGEFSERAFLNGKMDLAQAEAVADLIESSTELAARSAMRSLQGEFSKRVNDFLQELTHLRMFVEASIDFADEEIDFLGEAQVDKQLQQLLATLAGIQGSARQGRLLREGISVVLAGQPNAGKSSLHNRLAGHDAAIVTEVAGTTRDVLREQIHLGGLPLRISDTAGLHDATSDIVELEGIRRTQNELAQADHILLLIDDKLGITEQDEKILSTLPVDKSLTLIRNKIDQTGHPAEITFENGMTVIYLSAKNGVGMDLLTQHLCEVVGFHPEEEGVFMARRRHLDALQRAQLAIESGYNCLTGMGAGELLAEELRIAQTALGEITGTFTTEDLLDRIFSSFCIGK